MFVCRPGDPCSPHAPVRCWLCLARRPRTLVFSQVPAVDATLSGPDVPSLDVKKPKKGLFGGIKPSSIFKKGSSKAKVEVSPAV